MAFHEVNLPARLAFGSTGGIERRTEVVTLGSGFEQRSTPWAQGRRRYLIGANLRSLDDMAALTEFFEARRGRLYGFRFRDFADFKSCAPGGEVTATDQSLGSGDGTTTVFRLAKAYGDCVRAIAKPVAGSVRVAVAGVALDGAGFVVEATTGRVTLAVPPDPGAAVTAGFVFDTPVRFDADRIEVTLESFGVGRMAAVPLIEIRI
ncbi:MAG: phage distal tail protein, Rcc01695 family [Brevundimonas sp.]